MRCLLITLFFLTCAAAPSFATPCSSKAQRAHVTEIYPTADILPENLLRFYVYFSKPVQPSNSVSYVYLVDQNGRKVDGVFLDNKFNLWSPDGMRLTLLFDPGRVKTGLVAHNTMGRALSAGKFYTLVLDANLNDTDGCPITPFQKKFKATEADSEKPDIKKWRVEAPKVHTRNALTVTLNGSHDHVSMAYRIRIRDSHGQIVNGLIDLADNEQKWLFFPDKIWEDENYILVIDPVLEDISGNRITGSFEEPLNPESVENQLNWPSISFVPI